jgi:hypothetical protein
MLTTVICAAIGEAYAPHKPDVYLAILIIVCIQDESEEA